MYQFKLNGKPVQTEQDMNLLDYLRNVERLTSVKDGCHEGACGTCTVIISGKASKSCLTTTAKVNGKEIITTEGLNAYEQEVFSYAFAKAGAVQCGFCTPGMVMSAKALIDEDKDPSPEAIGAALKGNICRCTGYVKLIEAVKMSAELIKTGKPVPSEIYSGKIGEKLPRVDAKEKVLGKAVYVDDMAVDNMLYGTALRSRYPRALVKSINVEKALLHPDVRAIVKAQDIPGSRYIGHLVQDWPALIQEGEETRYIGDALALVAATKKEVLPEILDLIEVDYEVLTPMTCPEASLSPWAPKLHPAGNILKVERVKRGNVEEAIRNAKYTVTKEYSTPFTEHAFLEPEAALAMPEGDGVLIYTGSQGVYDEQREIAKLLGLPKEKVRAESKYVGGAFGGKEDMSVQHHAALLAYLTKQPVKITFSRKESISIHPKRHAMKIIVTTACDEFGNLTAFKARIVSDTGAYASLGGPVLQRACTHAAGPYRCPNVDIEGTAVYTNNPPAGAFRGFGVTQSVFASECNLNLLAEQLRISPWDIRFRNAIEPGQVLPNGQYADAGTAIKETLLAVKAEYEKHQYAGIACAMKNAGLGVGVPDFGRCTIKVKDGKLYVKTSAARVGQGLSTVILQIICATLTVKPDIIELDYPDSIKTPDSGTSTASRQTLFTGEAARRAALHLKKALQDQTLEELQNQEFYGEYEGVTDPIDSDKPNPVSHVAYSYATQVVILDEDGKLKKVVAAHDVGRAINPVNVEGQIEGGVVMGLGYALKEDFPLKDGVPTAKFGTLGLFRANEIPEINSIIIEKNSAELACGAKGIGEITTIPTAPAVQSAYYRFDGKFRTKLPLEGTFYRHKK